MTYDPLVHYGTAAGSFGNAYGLELFGKTVRMTPGSWLAVAAAPFTAGTSMAAWAALGGFKGAKKKYQKYRLQWKAAKRAGKTKKAKRLHKKMLHWKEIYETKKAELKLADKRKAARQAKKAERKALKSGGSAAEALSYDPTAEMDEMDYLDEGYDTGMDETMMDAGGGMPSWLPLALIGGAGLVLVMMMMKK